MGKISKKMLIAFVAATLVGTAMHFVYDMLPNPVTAILAPVNESIWEHLKLLFWPYLVAALVLTRGGEKGCRTPWFLSLLIQSALLLGLGWLICIRLGVESMVVNIALYVLTMGLGFVLPGRMQAVEKPGVRDGILLAVIALGAAIVLFTFLPPDQILFMDLSGANTWATIPY